MLPVIVALAAGTLTAATPATAAPPSDPPRRTPHRGASFAPTTYSPNALPQSACGHSYCTNWMHSRTTLPMVYKINTNGFSFDPVPAIRAAMSTWQNDAQSSVAFSYAGTTSAQGVVNGVSAIWGTFDPPTCGDAGTQYLACAGPSGDGTFVMWFNLNYDFAVGAVANKWDLESVALHEAGHTIGMDHTSDSTQVMYGAIAANTVRRTLGSGDLTGLRSLYPPKALPVTYDAGTWEFSNELNGASTATSFTFGDPTYGDVPQICDWNGDGIKTHAVYRPTTNNWHIKARNVSGSSDLIVNFGMAGDLPVCGDWDGDGDETVGVYRPSDGSWHLRNTNSAGSSNYAFLFGDSTDLPVVGDWDGNGTTTIGVYRPSDKSWHLRNSNSAGSSNHAFLFGMTGDEPVVGDWDANGTTTVGVYRPSAGSWHLRNLHSNGSSNVNFTWGSSTDTALSW